MSYHLPVIVSDIPANLEVGLKKDVYFQVGNIKELTDKLRKNIDQPYLPINYDMSKYNWDNIAEQVSEIYQKYIK